VWLIIFFFVTVILRFLFLLMVLVQELTSNKRWPIAILLSEESSHPQVGDFPRSSTQATDLYGV
jgi:hypothetical protein